MTRALVVGRRRPGRPIGRTIRAACERLTDAGWRADGTLVTTKRQLRKAAARAVRDGVDVIVAVGGDGAVHQVLQSVVGKEAALGIVPMGTGNLLAGGLGIPKGLDAVDVLLDGRPRRIDVGRAKIGGKRHSFAIACGVGFDAAVMDATDKESKRRFGKLAYLAAALRSQGELRDAAHELTIDGRTHTVDAAQVLVANLGELGGGLLGTRLEIAPDDGLLDLLVIRAAGPVDGLIAGLEALRQDDLGTTSGGHVYRARVRRVQVATARRRRVEMDGSVAGRPPVTVSVRPGALSIIVPRPDGAAPVGNASTT